MNDETNNQEHNFKVGDCVKWNAAIVLPDEVCIVRSLRKPCVWSGRPCVILSREGGGRYAVCTEDLTKVDEPPMQNDAPPIKNIETLEHMRDQLKEAQEQLEKEILELKAEELGRKGILFGSHLIPVDDLVPYGCTKIDSNLHIKLKSTGAPLLVRLSTYKEAREVFQRLYELSCEAKKGAKL